MPPSEDWPTAAVVRAAQRGDERALELLVAGAYPHVRRFAGALCPTPTDAEDAAQDAVVAMWRRIGALRTAGALAAWAFQIVRHECARRARQWGRTVPVADVPVVAVPGASGAADQRHALVAAIGALPADQRAVFVLRDLQGYSGRATAAALGLSTAAMKSRLHRARLAVRNELEVA